MARGILLLFACAIGGCTSGGGFNDNHADADVDTDTDTDTGADTDADSDTDTGTGSDTGTSGGGCPAPTITSACGNDSSIIIGHVRAGAGMPTSGGSLIVQLSHLRLGE